MRHVLVHGYSQVLPRILWNTAKQDIPAIKAQVEKYLADIDWDTVVWIAEMPGHLIHLEKHGSLEPR